MSTGKCKFRLFFCRTQLLVFQTSVFLRTLCVFRDQLILFGVYCCAFVDFFSQYCCPVNFKTAEKSTPKPFSIGLRAFFFKKSKPPENQIMMVGFAARGQDKKRMDLHEVPYPKKASAPFLWKKNRPLLLLLSVPLPRDGSPWCKCLPIGKDSVFGGYSDRVGIRQNPDGSVSQRAFAPEGRGSTSTLRYMDAAGRRDEGKVVFYQAQK